MQSKSFGGLMLMGLMLGCATAAPPPQASGTTAQGTQKEEKAAAADAQKNPDPTLICESVAVTGSHIPRKVCRTARQVEKERDDAQRAVQNADKVNRDWGK
ncbi:hypothetical protein [Hyalangium minutum]|uniref:Lipoprotein n=1 Tax=Hyalangium minutum TaxID=394096 RepID=A0A085WND9_9BACT|nr:hypothetical protein [Hyalangium minutum]KFE69202.1 hypothetical protein DB31_7104 [Hyalangium minutum]